MSILSWLGEGKNLQGLGSIIGAGGSIYGGIAQANAANKMIDLNNKQFDFNRSLLLEDEAKKRKQREAYAKVFGNGVVNLGDSKVLGYTDA